MRSNVKLGTISGIEIGLHYSWFIIAALIAFSLAEHFRQVNPRLGPGQIWIAALVTAALFFACHSPQLFTFSLHTPVRQLSQPGDCATGIEVESQAAQG